MPLSFAIALGPVVVVFGLGMLVSLLSFGLAVGGRLIWAKKRYG